MGLGLAVSQRLAQRLGGDLRAETPARGASFVVTLPADLRTHGLVQQVDALVTELAAALATAPCSVAIVRQSLGRITSGPALEEGLRRRLGHPACRVMELSATTLVLWSAAPVRALAPALAAALRQQVPPAAAARLLLSLRRVPQGVAADPVLLQAVVRCRHGLAALRRRGEVLHGPDPRR